MKIMKMKLIVAALVLFGTTGAFAQKTVATANDLPALEAAWVAGGPEYQAAVNKASDKYAEKMNARCQSFVDAKAAIAAYNVYTRPGAETARDQLVKKQVVTLACMGKYGDGAKRAARLRM